MNSSAVPMKEWIVERLDVREYRGRAELGEAAGKDVAVQIRRLQQRQDGVRIVFAAAPSQNEFLATLAADPTIHWEAVTAFHLDEYVGLAEDSSQSFRHYLLEHLFSQVRPGQVHLINGSAADPDEECRRYARLLLQEPIDIACIGIGENGHLAFNDPPVADFLDPYAVKVVNLEQKCREQQVNDGCFPSLELVPKKAYTMTIPTILSAGRIFCMVPGPSKTAAIRQTLTGPVSTQCPASVLRRHLRSVLYIDGPSAGGIGPAECPPEAAH